MKSVIPKKASSIVITKYNNLIEFLVLDGIWKASNWTEIDKFRKIEYNEISLNKEGTLWIVPLKKRDFENVVIGECPICKDQLTKFPGVLGTPSCSHIISQKHGGPMTKDNLIYLCSTCNSKCGQSDLREFIKERYPTIKNNFFKRFQKQFNRLNNNNKLNNCI
tara:strand:+ start:1845 stop:2336 length:492 start_codon:yes stop_codon:yes gene_type:complete